MAHRKRMSISSARSANLESPPSFNATAGPAVDDWVKTWSSVPARDLIDSPVVAVDAETSVEDACEVLLSKDVVCLAVQRPPTSSPHDPPFLGLFDFPDVNAFLTLAATRHRRSADELRERPRTEEIIAAAKAGRVHVRLVSNLSEKNPLETLPHDATIISLLTVFARGTHRVLIRAPPPSREYMGMISDRSLLQWFSTNIERTPGLDSLLSAPLSSFQLPSLCLYSSVVAAKANDAVLDAMRLMSDYGVSSVAVLEEEGGGLLSAVSVTDIGKIVVPSQSNQILSMHLHQFISLIKEPDGSTDGVDKYPVYSVWPNSTLLYTMQKLLATNSHRLFVSDDQVMPSPPSSGPSLSGLVSIVDILSLFARFAKLPGVDPQAMQRHRRASSTSSTSSRSPDAFHSHLARSRSSSRTSIAAGTKRLSVSSGGAGISPVLPPTGLTGRIPSFESLQWADRVPR